MLIAKLESVDVTSDLRSGDEPADKTSWNCVQIFKSLCGVFMILSEVITSSSKA